VAGRQSDEDAGGGFGGGLDLSPGKQVGKKGLVASGRRLRRLAQRALQLAANAGAACVGGALGWRQKPVNGPEAAGRRGLAVGGGSTEREVSPIHRVAKLLAGVALRVRSRVVAGQGIVRVRIVIEGGLALLRGAAKLR